MKKISFLILLLLLLLPVTSYSQTQYLWRYREHATDCTSLTDGKLRDLCFEQDDQVLYKCDPSSGDCDTPAEWKAISSAGAGGYTNLTEFVDQTAWRLFYSNADGDVTELALGADGTYLKSNGATSAPSFSASTAEPISLILASHNADQACGASMTDILFNTEIISEIGADISHSTVTATDNFTINTTGQYFIHYFLACDTVDNNSALQAQVRLNDNSVISGSFAQQNTSSSVDGNSVQHSFIANLTATNFITLQALKNTAGENWDADRCYISIHRLAGVKGDKGDTGAPGTGTTDTKCIYWENPVATDDFKSIWIADGYAVTITRIYAESDQTVTLNLQIDDGTPADVATADLAPAAGTATACASGCTTTIAAGAMASGNRLDMKITSVANTPTWCSVCFTFIYD